MTDSAIELPAGTRVLLAIPNKELASTLVAMLRNLGVEHARKAHDNSETLRLLAHECFDAIVIAADMAPRGGVQLTRTLRTTESAINRKTPVRLMSAVTEKAFIESARDAGISEFIRLPASAEVIAMRLHAALTKERKFVEASSYMGPDRRRQTRKPSGPDKRRAG